MSLINDLLEKGKQIIDIAKRPLIVAKLSRAFESAIDSTKEKEVDQEIKIQELRLKLVETPEDAEKTLNAIIACREEIRKAKRTAEIVEEERLLLFGPTEKK